MRDDSSAAAQPDVTRVLQGLASVQTRIARACPTGVDARSIAIMAVTKGFGPEAPRAAIAAGLSDLGENYYQEAAAKYALITRPQGVRLHFIGRVQRNKAPRIAELFDAVQTVEDLAIAKALDDAAAKLGKKLTVLVQVNAALDQRQGVMARDACAFAGGIRALKHLALRGVMAMGPRDARDAPSAFARARVTFEELRHEHPDIDTLSMGMSDDLESAVAAGSTMVRVGTALFGARPPKG